MRIRLIALLSMLFATYLFAAAPALEAQGTAVVWDTPVLLSDPDTFSWFADIVVDAYGIPHVIWDGGLSKLEKLSGTGEEVSLLMHSQKGPDGWTKPLDIDAKINVQGHIYRAAIAADPFGDLHILYEGHYEAAQSRLSGSSAAYWSEPERLGEGAVYMGAILADQTGVLHVLYDELTELLQPIGLGSTAVNYLADVYYQRSTDGGMTWSDPVNFSDTQVGEHREKLEMDPAGNIYATWDEGWDRLTENGSPARGVLKISRNGGETWSSRITFDSPDQAVAQFVATGDGRGGVLAVWRATTRDSIYYAWSPDYGVTWNTPQPVPFVAARPWFTTRFDSYDLTSDSAGTIHLAAVGRNGGQTDQVLHLSWNGREWSAPTVLGNGIGWPEYPRITVSEGNRLHLVWFVRNRLETDAESFYQIWYASATTSAPAQPLPSLPVLPTAVPVATPLSVSTTVAIAQPALSTEQRNSAVIPELSAEIYTENDEVLLVALSLIPGLLIVLAVVAYIQVFKYRR